MLRNLILYSTVYSFLLFHLWNMIPYLMIYKCLLYHFQDLDESLLERLWGLTEMFPEPLQKGFGNLLGFSSYILKTSFSFGRSALWIACSSATIMVLPVIFESERAQQQEQQLQQQRQVRDKWMLVIYATFYIWIHIIEQFY